MSDDLRTEANSREYLLGRIAGLMEADVLAGGKPMAFAFSLRADIAMILAVLRDALVDGRHL